MSKKQSAIALAQEEERKELERKKQLEEDRKINLQRIDAEIKEQTLRSAVLGDSVKDFEGLLRKVQEDKKVIRIDEKWKNYVDCNKVPNLNVPADVRDFMFQWRSSLQEYWDQQFNWWLKCDDRSVLTQSQREDTRRVLVKKFREKTGKFYERKLQMLLKVYNSLLDALRRKKMSTSYYEDLITIRNEFRETTLKFLDVLTFEVIKHIDREMESMNALMASYSFVSPNFVKFIWTFKDVPLPEDYQNLNAIKMEPLNTKIIISNLIDLSSTVVRGLWFKYDFFSDFCPSFNPPCEIKYTDLKTAVNNEWMIRKSISEKHLMAMKRAREAFEEKQEEKLKEEEKNKKSKKPENNEKKQKKTRVQFKEEPEPPIVDEATYVDVDDEYVQFEDNLFEEERESFSPDSLGLLKNEVNLREHQISNGIFKIECFERPLQTKEINFKLFLRMNGRPNIIKYHKFHHIYQPPNLEQIMMRKKSALARSQSIKLAEAREKALGDLVKVEIKLSEKLFWWESPTVCRWEVWEESDEFAKLDPKTRDYNLQYDEIAKKQSEKLFSAPNQHHYNTKIKIKDFDLNSPPKGIDRIILAKHYLVPMMPEQFKFFHEQLKIFEQKQREWRNILIAKRELNEASSWISNLRELFQQTWKEFDVTDVTIEKFKKFFDEKAFEPRNLFPIGHRKMIEALEDQRLTQQIDADREISRKQNDMIKNSEDVDIGELRPIKNAPVALSELLLQIEMVEKSLQPFLWEVQEPETAKLPENEPKLKEPQKKKSRLKSKTNFSRASAGSRSSQKPLRDLRRSKSKLSTRSSTASSRASSEKSMDESAATEVSSKSAMVLIQHPSGKWSTRDIYEPSYDSQTKTVTFYTGSLGTFGFATRKYGNFPFKNWEIYPVTEDSERFVVMKVVTQNVTIELKITNLGYTFRIINMKKVPFEVTKTPVKVNELKKVMAALNVNIFPEIDASWYVEKISEKHKAMECHTYKSMALYCLSHNFKSNVWNRWAHRRVAIFESRMIDKNVFTRVMTTPLRTASVNVREKCTDLDVVELDYDLTPADQEFHPDLLNFLKNEVFVQEHRKNIENFRIIWFVQALLINIRPLSFSE